MRAGGDVQFAVSERCSDGADLLGLRALGTLGDVELHALGLLERAVAAALDGAVVHEDVRAATVLGDEAEALFSVEPLDCSLCHGNLISLGRREPQARITSCLTHHDTEIRLI